MQTSKIHNSGGHIRCFENCHKGLGFIMLSIAGIDFPQSNGFAPLIEILKYIKQNIYTTTTIKGDTDNALNGDSISSLNTTD